jgi:hypothetical protein
MKNSQLIKAEAILAKAREAITLKDREGTTKGTIVRVNKYAENMANRGRVVGHEVAIELPQSMLISLETLEAWVKQAKTAARKGLI